jgi:pimeloyl-ACP methyl ester carboxylesterase
MLEFLDVGEVRIAFEREGRGPPLLLVHGAEASREMFAPLRRQLVPQFTVVAYDQRDCGQSEGPSLAASFADLASDAAALIHGLGYEQAHVFGSSFGGRVAQALALLHPECVDHLILGSTWALPLSHASLDPANAASIAKLRASLPESAESLAEWFFPAPFLKERPDMRQLFAGVTPTSDRSRRRRVTVTSTMECDIASIRAPTLVIAGELDRVVSPSSSMQLADLIPGSRRALLPGVGHATVLQAPDSVATEIMNFLMPKGGGRADGH